MNFGLRLEGSRFPLWGLGFRVLWFEAQGLGYEFLAMDLSGDAAPTIQSLMDDV